ncbi:MULTISPECIES: acylphosphatase [Halanaerobium]|uniref:Acylphosphatase n=1 Tax=Halanaerobium kushneri TaxID=56779 RepID=A0A1N6PUR5_9FIRM|nr:MULTISPECIES: acylphosphatase [Halanaerobium]RCW55672.1 acylphosphatase [Halanaerobium sp. ST460_2HS_T2]SIQ07997.1 acylphosphatase [Halanaerobium kushneri]
MAAEEIQKHIFISGRVQGVGFRAFTRKQAAVLDIKGWVKNLRDGRVEVKIKGKKNKVEKMINKLKEGPSFARVDNFEVKTEKADDFNEFEIRF